jgi:adenine-specific DNA methylase
MRDVAGTDERLIERWLPIAALSEESVRERRSMTALPAIYYLHVWWARRPLVASRAAVLASLLPADVDREKFMHVLGIHGDPVAAKRRIAAADRRGERLGANAYGYPRAFSYLPTPDEVAELLGDASRLVVVDPTAGGGAIPLEAQRLGLQAYANDLNPVACAILHGSLNLPLQHGEALAQEVEALGAELTSRVRKSLAWTFLEEPVKKTRPDGYLWARTITCPYCEGLVPLSPNWRLSPNGTGVRLVPEVAGGPGSAGRVCRFEIVSNASQQSEGTVADGDARCPYPDCARPIDGDEVKRQAQAGEMGEQLYCVVYKRPVQKRLKSGKLGKPKWVRGYRAPRPEDDNAAAVAAALAEKLPVWEASGVVPTEAIDEISNYDRGHRMYGMTRWIDVYSPRQLLGHGLAAETFRELHAEDEANGRLTDARKAAYVYLALSLDKLLNYNSRMSIWMPTREVIANTFNRHNFAMSWSHAEMAILVEGAGYDWSIEQTAKCIRELVDLSGGPSERDSLFSHTTSPASPAVITCKPGDALDHIEDATVDAVVIDPPYGANVMYAELSDFFYVWLKRTAGLVLPELFTRRLTDKESEAIANAALFKDDKAADERANRDYQHKMAGIFAECRRILKPDGIMTVMFTHKDTAAWDALTMGLMEAGFAVTASWPVNTEAEGSLHIKDKAAASSTIFLVCRPRGERPGDEAVYWEDVEPQVAAAVRARIEEFQAAGISGVDLYLASFGPALEVLSRHWPLTRGTPRPRDESARRRRQSELLEDTFDEFAVTPEDALAAARREVKAWKLRKLADMNRADLDPATAWVVLAWEAFHAPQFSYDEGLRLARAVGVDLETQVVGRLCEKKGANLRLWDSTTRVAKGKLGPADGSGAMIDAVHHAAYAGRSRSLEAARELLKQAHLDQDPAFLTALEAVLEVLPPSRSFVGFDVAEGEDAIAAANDFEALEKLRRLAFAQRIDEPKQLALFAEEAKA